MGRLPVSEFGPLAGLRVVFSGIEIAKPFAGQMFAEWRAEIIWIENVVWVDAVRVQPNYPQLSRHNLHVLLLSILEDEGRRTFLRLVRATDIFIEASKDPAFAHCGITDEALWRHSPKLVVTYLSGFGQYGVGGHTDLLACNVVAQTLSGYLVQNGDVDQPIPAFPYTAGYFSGLTVTTAAPTTLHKVRETGKNESIDIAIYEVILRMGQYFMMDYLDGDEMCPHMIEDRDPYYAGYSLYKCTDGYVVMELVGITQIIGCFGNTGPTHLLDTPEILRNTQLIHRIGYPRDPLVEEELDAWLAAHTIAEVKERFAKLNIACTKVLTVPELESNPQYVACESITQWQTMDGRACKGPGIMPKFKDDPGQVWCEIPSHGVDTAATSRNIGYNEDDIWELVSRGLTKVED